MKKFFIALVFWSIVFGVYNHKVWAEQGAPIDVIQDHAVKIHVYACDEKTYQQAKASVFDGYADSDKDETEAIAASQPQVQRKGADLVFATTNGKKTVFTTTAYDEKSGKEASYYSYQADMKAMDYWLVNHTVLDFSNWILVNKQTGESFQVYSQGAFSPSGKYYMVAICGGEGDSCNNAKLYLYENKQNKLSTVLHVSLMPEKGWMPSNIKWLSDSKAVAKVELEQDDDGQPLQPPRKAMPQYVILEIE